MSAAGDSLSGFTLVRHLKTHGSTEVWQGTRDADGLDVAVKFAPSGTPDARRLVREQTALSLVSSRKVVATAGFAEEGGRVLLALDWCRGGTLREKLAADGPLPVHAAGELARDLLVALGNAHAAGVVHRDVKPGNVFLTEFGEARLGDFGIALLPGERPKRGAVIGSAAYMSPEQTVGGRLDARSDLYSLGLWMRRGGKDDGWFGHGGAWRTSCSVNWQKRQLRLWAVQQAGDSRLWEDARDAAAEAFFKAKLDTSGADAYTGRMD